MGEGSQSLVTSTATGGGEFKPTVHPVLGLPSAEQLRVLAATVGGREWLQRFLILREEKIRLMDKEPLEHGWEPQCWRDADGLLEEALLLVVLGGNGAAKTFYEARTGVNTLLKHPRCKVLFLAEAELSSINIQQPAVWRYLPSRFKGLKKGAVTNVQYSEKNGFSGNRFVLPNGSIAQFGTYNQVLGDYEGTGWKLICADENLPLAWLKTLLIRLPRCGGKFIWTFTPIQGITPAVKEVTEGARTVRALPAELLPAERVNVPGCGPGTMPYVQESTWEGSRIIYFFSEMNLFGGYPDFKRIAGKEGMEWRERRAYGYARNTARSLFPLFGAVNLIDRGQVPEDVTRYLVADPAGARNMFMIWVAVDEHGRHFVYREWPDVESVGEWAVAAEDSSLWDGKPGGAQPTLGYGVVQYKRLIWTLEGAKAGRKAAAEKRRGWELDEEEEEVWDGVSHLAHSGEWSFEKAERIEKRLMDPRSGKAQVIAEDQGGASLMDRMKEAQVEKETGLLMGPMEFEGAPGLDEEEGIGAINELLAYNREEPIAALVNEPRLYVVRSCRNFIWAMQNYTMRDGKKAACKDPVDVARYMATSKLEHYDGREVVTGGYG